MAVLASLVRQLAAQINHLPAEIGKLYDKLEVRSKKPLMEELYAALVATFKSFDQVFLVFDALDEYDPKTQRKEPLPLFHRMVESGANLFVASRQHPEDIQESFRVHGSAMIELSPREDDIAVYIRQRIDEDPWTTRLIKQPNCKENLVSELISSSQGM